MRFRTTQERGRVTRQELRRVTRQELREGLDALRAKRRRELTRQLVAEGRLERDLDGKSLTELEEMLDPVPPAPTGGWDAKRVPSNAKTRSSWDGPPLRTTEIPPAPNDWDDAKPRAQR